MDKILFLDIDGVLTTRGTSYFSGSYALDPVCVGNATRILDETGAKVVWSTNWRGIPGNVWLHDGVEIRGLFPQARELFAKYELGTQMPRKHGEPKFYDIMTWLRGNMWAWNDFAIVDDQSDQQLSRFGENFFKTDFDLGITETVANRVIEYLNDVG